ncbi:MAG TPA: NADH-quinone oxidoreductase subunit L [Pirellulales bacterium]|nr:NADH-quinone oxidoreductase subunit L [Pirellulales bacterium]
MDAASLLPTLLAAAWLLPLASFALIVLFGPKMGKSGILASYVATGAIVTGCVLSTASLIVWCATAPAAVEHEDHEAHGHSTATTADQHGHESEADVNAHPPVPPHYISGDWYTLGQFGNLRVTISYYIDALTVIMFAMVTLIASCIHFYAIGYMHDELHDVTDHEVVVSKRRPHEHGHPDGHEAPHESDVHAHAPAAPTEIHADEAAHGHAHADVDHPALPAGKEYLKRPGRFHRFFQYLSLFCVSMLGLVIAGNIAMVFVFWELVGICSYFLIGFYIERKSASNAANKAFIVNRVGDFGMIIGLMALWAGLGTFAFGDIDHNGNDTIDADERGIFSQVRSPENHYNLVTPDGLVRFAAQNRVADIMRDHEYDLERAESEIESEMPNWRDGNAERRDRNGLPIETPAGMPLPDKTHYGYWLLVVAGLGIFCGCVGKSAQFPLHVWLPDAMEGPTPVSALVHSATMVAAGVYLVGRFYPVFAPEVLLTIAYIGAITLFLAATIAITATDIKRVLAYSTVSQLGYMMLALGVGGWLAGMFHLITHAFFKSLLFLCSGSVIHACHTNEMPRMGGLRKKMPWTAYTMLIGCLAIAGAPMFSGFYSKDAIIAQAMNFAYANPRHAILFYAVAAGAAITAFYMFRLWYMTFAGKPRDEHIYDHAHESPPVMTRPLVVLSVFAVAVGWEWWGLTVLLEQARPAGEYPAGILLPSLQHPNEHLSHAYHMGAMLVASATALAGFLMATIFYGWRLLSAADVRQQFGPIYNFLLNKWYFDELYQAVFVEPVLFVSNLIAMFDKRMIDRFIDWLAVAVKRVAQLDDMIDRYFVDGLVNLTAHWTWSIGRSLRTVQTGRLRQYVMFIVLATVVLAFLIQWSAAAGR